MLFACLQNLPYNKRPEYIHAKLTQKGTWLLSARADGLTLNIELGHNEFRSYLSLNGIEYDINKTEFSFKM